MPNNPIIIATRGSALALTQANMMLAECRSAFPEWGFEIRIYKTTGDKLQTASLASQNLPKGLFTKELEQALLDGSADLAVHSLKDLPTELPEGLILGAVSRRADVRDVLVYRDARLVAKDAGRGFGPGLKVADLPQGATIATSSNRRGAQIQEVRPDIRTVPIRGNVPTRLVKLTRQPELDATILPAAGMDRLGFRIDDQDRLSGEGVPEGLLARKLSPEEVLPCVGQAAIGIEVRAGDERMAALCARLNHQPTMISVLAERAFLRAMGGGCQVPIGALAEVEHGQLRMRVVSYLQKEIRRAESVGSLDSPEALGAELASKVR